MHVFAHFYGWEERDGLGPGLVCCIVSGHGLDAVLRLHSLDSVQDPLIETKT